LLYRERVCRLCAGRSWPAHDHLLPVSVPSGIRAVKTRAGRSLKMLRVWQHHAIQQQLLSSTRWTQMSDFGTELARLMAARGLGVRELARMVPCNPGHISNLRSGKARPSAELAGALDERLEAGGSLRALVPAHDRRRPQPT